MTVLLILRFGRSELENGSVHTPHQAITRSTTNRLCSGYLSFVKSTDIPLLSPPRGGLMTTTRTV